MEMGFVDYLQFSFLGTVRVPKDNDYLFIVIGIL